MSKKISAKRPVYPLLSKRELFAAMAMQGTINFRVSEPLGTAMPHPTTIAHYAIKCADALLAELKREEK